ncbi:unnamed protein product [Trichobilharzia szidati]|nr:unnamed protein product [Trichobilharzia szidati]CAH8837904.1 unnamed protein product [Trichobilharzia szidati]
MIYFKCCAQTTCSEEYLICILLILCSIFNVQSHNDNSNNNNNEINNNSLNQSINIDSSVLNPELIRMRKEAESSLDNHNNNNNNNHNNRIGDIEHIEHDRLDTLTDHLNNANKGNTDNNDMNNINDDDLLKSLSNMIRMYHRFPNTETNNENSNNNNNERSGTTFTFIEMIVQRTVNKYMNVIRTRSDWLKRLLQLVKEERDIRSRYNCYTDACIYKIQLFTTQLKAHLLRNTAHLDGNHAADELHLKRFRRSSFEESLTPSESSPAEGVAPAATKPFDLNDSTVEVLHDDPGIPDVLLIHPNDHDDDALRLPSELHKLNILKEHSENAHENDGDVEDNADNNHFDSWTNNNNNDSRQKSIKFDNTHKIDVARFSQDLVNGVLSKHTKSQTVTVPTVTKMPTTTATPDMLNSIMRNDSSIDNISPLSVSTPQPNLFAQMSGEENPFLQNHEDDVDSDLEVVVSQLHDAESSKNIADKVPSISADHELKGDEVIGTVATDGTNNISLSQPSTLGESEVQKEEKGAVVDTNGETLPLPLFESAAYTTDIPTAFSDAMPTSDLVDVKVEELQENTTPPQSSSTLPTFTTTTADIRQTDIYTHSMKPSLNIRAISLTVEETLVIPFGLNKFNGRPYENCTGQYETYCYNAIKCVYISVLETAACYCRTGYTGVRCDMFNLPQTLDILKSFREESIDISSLQQPTAYILHNVIEATARYTVNAVLEESLLSTWEDDTPF